MREYGAEPRDARLCWPDVSALGDVAPAAPRLSHNSLRALFDSMRQLHTGRRNIYKHAHPSPKKWGLIVERQVCVRVEHR